MEQVIVEMDGERGAGSPNSIPIGNVPVPFSPIGIRFVMDGPTLERIFLAVLGRLLATADRSLKIRPDCSSFRRSYAPAFFGGELPCAGTQDWTTDARAGSV